MQYATCTANRPTSIGSSSSNGLTAHSSTGKSLSEALLLAEHGENMLCTEIALNVNNNICTQYVFPMF